MRRMKVDYGDAIGKELRRQVGEAVVSPERTREALESALMALGRQAEVLATMDYVSARRCPACREIVELPPGPREVAQAAASTTKVLDDIYRLGEFAAGRADSRSQVLGGPGGDDLMAFLTDQQLTLLNSWVEEGKERRGTSVPTVQ